MNDFENTEDHQNRGEMKRWGSSTGAFKGFYKVFGWGVMIYTWVFFVCHLFLIEEL